MEESSKQINTQLALTFRKMHESSSIFVMPCAWDAFSAMLFERAGFACIGTTSGGVNWVRGRKDYVYSTPRTEMMNAYAEIANATFLPVSGDLENGYGVSPEDVSNSILASINAGMVGGSIEDQGLVPSDAKTANGELIEFELAVERIQAARKTADATIGHYTLTARCEVFYSNHRKPYEESVKRLNAYREAGADCLFVPGLNDIKRLAQLVKDVDGPVSFGMGATPEPLTISMLEDIGIRRVSTGGGLTRATFSLVQTAVSDMLVNGQFTYLENAMSEHEINLAIEG